MTRITTLKAFFPHFPPEALRPEGSRLLAWAGGQRQRAALARRANRVQDDIGVTRAEAAVGSRRLD